MEVNKCFTLEEMLRAAHIHCWEEVSEATTTPDQLWRCKAALTDDDDDGSRTCDALIRRTIKPRPVHWQTLELLESGSVIVARPLEFSFSEKKTVNKKTLHDNKNYNPDNDHFNVYLLTERSPTAVHIACREFSGWITTPQLAKLKFVDFKTREPVSFSPIEPPAAAKLPL
ncbi:MAG: hypothetical protein Harvfovirus6_37 [Harvfovirus sp.]|uniref:Uncharacterized protein n=1 Tax=Harvfovirus sp. TaxID=2487768 RepID=A0A3G5A0R9_9VIRU|nr:MAG: hypothetical protein Harvfovirus6_37 [Harvfovirus sp.]